MFSKGLTPQHNEASPSHRHEHPKLHGEYCAEIMKEKLQENYITIDLVFLCHKL